MMTRPARRRMKRFFKRHKPWIFLVSVLLGLAVAAAAWGCAPRQEVPMPKSQEEVPKPRHDDFVVMNSGIQPAVGDELELPPRETERPKRGNSIPYERDPSVPLDRWEKCTFTSNIETGLSELICFRRDGWPHYYGPMSGVHRGPARRTARAMFF
ncbi:MAG: hypothetical protein HY456_02670 [Parcubacteria group bacterium]|nr:hypothetical protein [Parcubacteria group bacterium]